MYRMLGPFGKLHHMREVRKRYPGEVFANFDMNRIYPWDHNHVEDMASRLHTRIPGDTFGIHWYAGSKLAQSLNAILNEKTVRTHQSTIAHFLREVMQAKSPRGVATNSKPIHKKIHRRPSRPARGGLQRRL